MAWLYYQCEELCGISILLYRRFMPHFAMVATPLHDLMKKDVPFQWLRKCEDAFCKLKLLLAEAPVLVYPQFGLGKAFLPRCCR
jgi:hypothetical protein